MTISQIDKAISNFVNYIEARHERVVGGNDAIKVDVTENGIFLKYNCPSHPHSYSTKVDMMSSTFISEVNVLTNYDLMPFAPEDND